MNTSSLTHVISDHVPSPSEAAASISSNLDDLTDRLPEIEVPDLSRAARRTRRVVTRLVPGTNRRGDERRSARWLLLAAAIVTAITILTLLRRRCPPEPVPRRDDWTTASDRSTEPPRPSDRPEPATTVT